MHRFARKVGKMSWIHYRQRSLRFMSVLRLCPGVTGAVVSTRLIDLVAGDRMHSIARQQCYFSHGAYLVTERKQFGTV